MPHTGLSMDIDARAVAEGGRYQYGSLKSRPRSTFREICRITGFCTATLIVILAMTSCHQVSEPARHSTNREAFPLERRIGWFHGRCFAISDANLARGTTVDLVVMGEPQTVRQAKVGEQTSSAASCPPLMEGRRRQNARAGTSFYRLKETKLTATDMGIGILAPPHKPTVVNGLAETDLNSDGQHEVFSSCATTEGIKFAVWTQRPYQGTPLWSTYYYLGYDMNPTCH